MASNDQHARGTGGKSLELMQQRLLSKPQGAPADATPQNPPQNQQQQPSSTHHPMGGRGKDFAAMAASAGSASKARASPPPPPQPLPQNAQQQQAAPAAAPAVAAGGGRPKGKDFSAMANRMGAPTAPSPAPAPPPAQGANFVAPPTPTTVTAASAASQASVTANVAVPPQVAGGLAAGTSGPILDAAAQAARAAYLQAEARAAAGLPPLEKPTATSVTRVPPPVAPVRQKQFVPQSTAAVLAAQAREQHSAKISLAAASVKKPLTNTPLNRSSSTGARRTSGGAKQPLMQQQQSQQQQQQQQQASVVSNTTPKTAAPPAVTTPIPSKPTSQPVASEARLSNAPRATPSSTASSSVSPGVGGPHLAPLIGQRLQDLVKSIDPNYVIEPEAEEQVLQLADDFLEKVTRQSIRLAHHRGSKTLDVQDVQMVLSKQWGIVIPGLGPPSFKPTKTPGSGNKAGVPQSGGSAGGSAGSLKRKTMDGNAAAENRNKRANLGGLPPPPLTSTSTAGNSGFI